jgi:hypothetical protein
MKSLVLAAALALSTSAFANPANIPSDFPTESGWALGMISMACKVPTSQMKALQVRLWRSKAGLSTWL